MTSKYFFKFSSAMIIAATLLLAACHEAPSKGTNEKVALTPVSMAAIGAEAKGFEVGSQMSARTIYVFFDAQCSHCGALWNAAKPLKSQAKFVWIPVGLLNPSSTAQGATLLAAKDPAATMDEHETSLLANRGGISAGNELDAQKALVAKNTELMNRLGFSSVPSIVGIHAQTGALVTKEGAMSTVALASLLGLQTLAAQPALTVN
ncbi:MAG: thioredoxin fold domain-containing protein [Pseudomonadota bacterium]|nr:thioredoxin fold domain-containing protein [Pseudomonadota bacterium]